jgi:membrane protease YdiL (CAAX protease family)
VLAELPVPNVALVAVAILLALAVAAYFVARHGRNVVLIAGALCIAFILGAMGDAYFATAVLALFMLCMPFYWLARQGKAFAESAEELGLTKKRLLDNLLLVVPLLIATFAVLLVLTLIYTKLGILDSQKVAGAIEGVPLYILLIAIVVSPITEEIFFRGFLTPRLGIPASATLFALSHLAYGSISEVINVFFIGLIFAYVFSRRRSLVATIAAHILINSVAIYAIRFAGLQ